MLSNLRQRPYQGESDWPAITELIESDPGFYHPVDFPWRLCSTSMESPRNVAMWEDAEGRLQIFAALQFPWLTLDYAIRPEIRTWDIEVHVLDWADSRLAQVAAETNDEFPFNVSALDNEDERIALLERRGYTRWENDMVMFNRPLDSLPVPQIPPGFTIRSFGGESELEQYTALQRAAFDSTTMTVPWRRHTLHAPYYNPDLDLVAVAPDGQLAGFCIWWHAPKRKVAQIEPLGVHPTFQHLGLSQALMAEGFRRIAALGAESALVQTYSFSEPALKAYEAAGFKVIAHELKYYKEY